jgi:hypothetical protein
MKRTMLSATAALCLLSGTPTALYSAANETQDVAGCDNAAVAYLHAIELIRSSGHSEQLQSIDWRSLEGKAAWQDMPEDFKAAFANIPQQAIRAFLRGSQMPCCEFYIARDEGIYAVLPHLGQIRAVARVVRLDARGQLAQGNVEAAAERVAALLRLSTQTGRDQLLISSLVGVAIAVLAHDEAQLILTGGRDTPEARRILQAAIEAIPEDPFHFRPTIGSERDWMLVWMGCKFTGKDAGLKLMTELGELGSGWAPSNTPQEIVIGIAMLDEEGLRREIKLLEGYYTEVARVWDGPEAVARLEELNERATRGEFGMLFPFSASFAKAKASEERAEAALERTRTLLAGEDGR